MEMPGDILTRVCRSLLAGMVFAIILASAKLPAQGLPMATATLACGAEDDPERLERELTGLFSRADSIVFNGACDGSEVFDTVFIQELADVVAISGPQAQAIAEIEITVDVGPIPDCPAGGTANGFGDYEAVGIITFSVALSEQQTPPFTPSTVPGKVLLSAGVVATVEPPSMPFPDFDNFAFAAATLLDPDGMPIITLQVESDVGTVQDNAIEQEFSVDLFTDGQIMEFTKAAFVQGELGAVEPCEGGESRVRAFAAVDPVFVFDQARFDAEQGANSFPLDQFYQINISPNINELLLRDGFENNELLIGHEG